jgi:Ni/Fe-hydrogenase subunit HybB-like protein
MEQYPAHTYFPSLIEIFIMLGITAIGFTAFTLIVKYLPIFEPKETAHGLRKEAVTGLPEAILLARDGGDLKSS